jgi:hypothetical protein
MMGELWAYPDSVGRLDVTGYDVEALDGEIGTVDETSLEVDAGYLLIDTGRWIFGKKVVIPAGLVERVDRDDETVFIGRTKDEIQSAPELDDDQYRDPSYRDKLAAYYAASTSREQGNEGE